MNNYASRLEKKAQAKDNQEIMKDRITADHYCGPLAWFSHFEK
jgi:hypothetical protein